MPYLKLWGIVAGGWQMARAALIAKARLDGGAEDFDFYRAKIGTARFYAEHILPQAHCYKPGHRQRLDQRAGAGGSTALDRAVPVDSVGPLEHGGTDQPGPARRSRRRSCVRHGHSLGIGRYRATFATQCSLQVGRRAIDLIHRRIQMMTLIWILGFIGLAWVLRYFRAPRWVWTAAGAAFLAGVSLRGGLVPGWRATLWTPTSQRRRSC